MLNYAWIRQLFKVEEFDKKLLEDPEGEIIAKGGEILIALMDGVAVGTCALIRKNDHVFELAKMAVSEAARGNKIGWKLGLGIVEKAKDFGASRLFLETNSELKPAINLYKKLGFRENCETESLYDRCNVKMEMDL